MKVRFPNPLARVSSLKGTVTRLCLVGRADCGSQDGCLLVCISIHSPTPAT